MRRRCIGLVREAYSKWERRAPLTPAQVKHLVRQEKIDVLVHPSSKRIFSDAEYAAAGAIITKDLSGASVIFGVKQVPIDELIPNKTYMFFSHTIKGQAENMPLLNACLSQGIRLIDYECVRQNGDLSAPRLIAFGEFAGKAGMIESLRGLGARFLSMGFSTPFLSVAPAYAYPSYQAACEAVAGVGREIKTFGLPSQFSPLVFGFAGKGNVSIGAKHFFNQLGPDVVTWVSPEALPELTQKLGSQGEHSRRVYGCEFGAEHMVRARDEARLGQAFDRSHYYAHPELYEPTFHETLAPHLSCLVTTMYWDRRFPRMLTTAQMKEIREKQLAAGAEHPRLLQVADITCDVAGAVEFLVRDSSVEDPFYLFDVENEREATSSKGLDGSGVVMMGVDILPSELPREASQHFGSALTPFIPALLDSDPTLPWKEQGGPGKMPPELHAATISCHGELTPAYAYIKEISRTLEREAAQPPVTEDDQSLALEGSTVLSIRGHLFDSGLINKTLDAVEEVNGRFDLLEVSVLQNAGSDNSAKSRYLTSALLQVTIDGGRPALDEWIAQVKQLAIATNSEAEIMELRDFCKGVYDRTLLTGSARTVQEAEVTHTAPKQRVVVLGAGLCAGPAVEYLCRTVGRSVTLVSAIPGEASALAAEQRGPAHCEAITLSCSPSAADDWAQVAELIRGADAVLSLLPAPMHAAVAKVCVENDTPMVTASYVSPEMRSLHDEAAKANVPVLCEMGLDPGMDHMSAMRVIERAKAAGGFVREFKSVCGGLPAPEAADNPLMYKFSWSPAGVLSAAENSAKYRENGAIVDVPPEQLLHSAVPLPSGRLGRVLNLEVLPNRDSLPYGSLYGIDDAATVFRGTLRYKGWSDVMAGFKALGLLDASRRTAGAKTWAELSASLGLERGSGGADARVAAAVSALEWLGAFDATRAVSGASVREAFCALLAERMGYGEQERDAVFLEHSFSIDWPEGRGAHSGENGHATSGAAAAAGPCTEYVSSSFVGFGEPGGQSMMSKTVGLTAAIGVRLLLERRAGVAGGVLTPTDPAVYDFCLDRLAEEGIIFAESSVFVPRTASSS